MARHYYIDGSRGEVKKIALPRDLVVWELREDSKKNVFYEEAAHSS